MEGMLSQNLSGKIRNLSSAILHVPGTDAVALTVTDTNATTKLLKANYLVAEDLKTTVQVAVRATLPKLLEKG